MVQPPYYGIPRDTRGEIHGYSHNVPGETSGQRDRREVLEGRDRDAREARDVREEGRRSISPVNMGGPPNQSWAEHGVWYGGRNEGHSEAMDVDDEERLFKEWERRQRERNEREIDRDRERDADREYQQEMGRREYHIQPTSQHQLRHVPSSRHQQHMHPTIIITTTSYIVITDRGQLRLGQLVSGRPLRRPARAPCSVLSHENMELGGHFQAQVNFPLESFNYRRISRTYLRTGRLTNTWNTAGEKGSEKGRCSRSTGILECPRMSMKGHWQSLLSWLPRMRSVLHRRPVQVFIRVRHRESMVVVEHRQGLVGFSQKILTENGKERLIAKGEIDRIDRIREKEREWERDREMERVSRTKWQCFPPLP